MCVLAYPYRCLPFRPAPTTATIFRVTDQAADRGGGPHGVGLLPRDLTEDELNAAPILVSADTWLIDDLTVDEDESFAAALAR